MRTTPQAKKAKIIADLIAARQSILETAAALPLEKQNEVFLGVWSVKDLLAHLVGWDYTNLQAAKEVLAGQLPGFYAHYDRDWQTFNAGLVAQYQQEPFANLLLSAEHSHQELVDFLKALPAEEFVQDRGVRSPRGRKVTIAMLIQAEAGDEGKHCTQIKTFTEHSKSVQII